MARTNADSCAATHRQATRRLWHCAGTGGNPEATPLPRLVHEQHCSRRWLQTADPNDGPTGVVSAWCLRQRRRVRSSGVSGPRQQGRCNNTLLYVPSRTVACLRHTVIRAAACAKADDNVSMEAWCCSPELASHTCRCDRSSDTPRNGAHPRQEGYKRVTTGCARDEQVHHVWPARWCG